MGSFRRMCASERRLRLKELCTAESKKGLAYGARTDLSGLTVSCSMTAEPSQRFLLGYFRTLSNPISLTQVPELGFVDMQKLARSAVPSYLLATSREMAQRADTGNLRENW